MDTNYLHLCFDIFVIYMLFYRALFGYEKQSYDLYVVDKGGNLVEFYSYVIFVISRTA